ncbi:GntR family transcriptional regulator [Aeromicrobium sp. A1-2]|uniref:GntR family transcriptional regulator n=1 Tax=Aeromicrobium sp. A1-2 TaxID=2107713 RepID=UPI000E4D48DC|nr:GntR family transcriptional regulator [Aeromicrobium sp. A1-2]AXT83973.1 GntR family transcriptional regulator [Aeromicrobium sp. A1-2]
MAQRTTTTDRVFAALRESIVTGEFPAGSLHSIYRLAELLDVSRTPVREAVLRLADIGLVSVERNRGVRIRGVTVGDVRSVFELRLMIEVPATAYAAGHATAQDVEALEEALVGMRAGADALDEVRFTGHDRTLHHRIAAVLGNPRLQQEVAALRDSIQTRGASTLHRSRGMTEILEEHVPIVEAIASKNPAAAAARMEEHLVNTATLLMAQAATPDDPAPGAGWANRLQEHLYLPEETARTRQQ